MRQEAFEAELGSAGYTQIESKALDPKPANVEHAHDYDIRGMVLDGVFIVKQGDQSVAYRTGDIFEVPAGKRHSEEIGPNGARVLVGRKY
jgi:quercetin dioxygenase-like cupin family protein